MLINFVSNTALTLITKESASPTIFPQALHCLIHPMEMPTPIRHTLLGCMKCSFLFRGASSRGKLSNNIMSLTRHVAKVVKIWKMEKFLARKITK